MGKLGPRLKVRGMEEPLIVGQFATDTVLLAENEGMLQRIGDEYDKMSKRVKLRVNAGKNKVMVIEIAREPYPLQYLLSLIYLKALKHIFNPFVSSLVSAGHTQL